MSYLSDRRPCALAVPGGDLVCNGPVVWDVLYFTGAGAHAAVAETVGPVCWVHATYEQHVSQLDMTLRRAEAHVRRQPALTVEDCTHGDGCPVHVRIHAVHNFDPLCGGREIHRPHIIRRGPDGPAYQRGAYPPERCGGGYDPADPIMATFPVPGMVGVEVEQVAPGVERHTYRPGEELTHDTWNAGIRQAGWTPPRAHEFVELPTEPGTRADDLRRFGITNEPRPFVRVDEEC